MSRFPIALWRYEFSLEVAGTDRTNLPLCLEAEELALWAHLPREEAYARLRAGHLAWRGAFEEPYQAFPGDLATLSAYLFQIVSGIELWERHVSPTESDDARAWKVVARRGEWVKVPLLVGRREEGGFSVDPEKEDVEIVAARWRDYPRWFQDAMRFRHPPLRHL
jgi:hypothetical protein